MDEFPKRKDICIKNYDYSRSGCYFITVCAKDRQSIFWDKSVIPSCVDDIKLSPMGEVVKKCWKEINSVYSNIIPDCYAIMPDHFHGIIVIDDDLSGERDIAIKQDRPSLSEIVQGFKSVTTRMCYEYGYRQIWQRGYYEHIIRDREDYNNTVGYILNNHKKWINNNGFLES